MDASAEGDFTPPSARQRLATPVAELPGVTGARAELFARLGLLTARDVLFYFPRDHHDLTDVRELPDLEEGVLASVQGEVEDLDVRRMRRGGSIVSVLIRQAGNYLRGSWFNQLFIRDKFALGQRVMFSGKPKFRGGRWEMSHPRVQWLADDEDDVAGRVLPVYGLTEGLKQRHVRHLARIVVEELGPLVEEVFPPEFLEAHRLWPIAKALPQIHFPDNRESLFEARRRFVYQELFILQLGLAVRRLRKRSLSRATPLITTAKINARIRRLFPFELTAAQDQAIAQIAADLGQTWPMNRLLQGDVGSGKTMVAIYAMLLAVAHGCQAVVMAPTEVLARQHAQTLERVLEHSQVRRALLVGGLADAERHDLLRKIAAGEIDVVVGTQAVLQASVRFARLGLVVIDEQHKFGVRQRAVLKEAGGAAGGTDDTPAARLLEPTHPDSIAARLAATAPARQARLFQTEAEATEQLDPHYLVMTATPIPRSLTMTLFGDLDVSTLREAPPGRQPVHTYVVGAERRASWWEFFRKKLDQGRQGFVVAPLVEESSEVEAANVRSLHESLQAGELANYSLGLLHGRMAAAEKQAVMRAFHRREIQVLIATTVIEVGVDVPNATLLVIEDGERFGLSQLHQLRGRICRGSFPGFCCVFADPQTADSQKRLEAFAKTTDGFALAEEDFAIRGPGDLFGTQQHGLPPLRIADLVRDANVVEEARRDALALVEADAGLALPEHAKLRRMMLVRYGRVLNLGDVG